MYIVTISIEAVNYDKLIGIIGEQLSKSNSKGKAIFGEALEIIRPFAGKTLDAIPPSAIAKLFNLLAKEKLTKLAADYGITVSEITVKPD